MKKTLDIIRFFSISALILGSFLFFFRAFSGEWLTIDFSSKDLRLILPVGLIAVLLWFPRLRFLTNSQFYQKNKDLLYFRLFLQFHSEFEPNLTELPFDKRRVRRAFYSIIDTNKEYNKLFIEAYLNGTLWIFLSDVRFAAIINFICAPIAIYLLKNNPDQIFIFIPLILSAFLFLVSLLISSHITEKQAEIQSEQLTLMFMKHRQELLDAMGSDVD